LEFESELVPYEFRPCLFDIMRNVNCRHFTTVGQLLVRKQYPDTQVNDFALKIYGIKSILNALNRRRHAARRISLSKTKYILLLT